MKKQSSKPTEKLNFKRATIYFLLAYVAITAVAFWFYLLLVQIQGVEIAPASAISTDPTYNLAEKYYPLLNLVVWTFFAWLYFRKAAASVKSALYLSLFWLAIVLPLDLLAFVLIENPLAVSAYDFYVSQFPWIYLTYIALALSPFVALLFTKKR